MRSNDHLLLTDIDRSQVGQIEFVQAQIDNFIIWTNHRSTTRDEYSVRNAAQVHNNHKLIFFERKTRTNCPFQALPNPQVRWRRSTSCSTQNPQTHWQSRWPAENSHPATIANPAAYSVKTLRPLKTIDSPLEDKLQKWRSRRSGRVFSLRASYRSSDHIFYVSTTKYNHTDHQSIHLWRLIYRKNYLRP